MLNTHLNGAVPASPKLAMVPQPTGLIEAISEEELRLAAELAEVMSRKLPAYDASSARAAAPAMVTALDAPDHDGSFAWQPNDGDAVLVSADGESFDDASNEADLAQGVVPASTLQWLRKAKSERRWAAAQQAGAWAVTFVIGGVIIASAAYLLTGQVPNLPALVSAAISRVQ